MKTINQVFGIVAMAAAMLVSCKPASDNKTNQDMTPRKILLVVDLQKDFINGNLSATDAEPIVPRIDSIKTQFDAVYFTLDWHPANHCSFADQGGPWPVHCVHYTLGASLPDCMLLGLDESKTRFFVKGCDPELEEYGAFSMLTKENQDLFNPGDEVTVCGIAAEYCVLETLKNVIRLSKEIGFTVKVYMDGVACIVNNDPLLEYMKEEGIAVVK